MNLPSIMKMRDDFDRLFDTVWDIPARMDHLLEEVNQDEDNITVTVVLPGFSENDITIDAIGNQLIIKASQSDDGKYHRSMRATERVISLPREVNLDSAQAELENGILKVSIERAESSKPKRIAVNSPQLIPAGEE